MDSGSYGLRHQWRKKFVSSHNRPDDRTTGPSSRHCRSRRFFMVGIFPLLATPFPKSRELDGALTDGYSRRNRIPNRHPPPRDGPLPSNRQTKPPSVFSPVDNIYSGGSPTPVLTFLPQEWFLRSETSRTRQSPFQCVTGRNCQALAPHGATCRKKRPGVGPARRPNPF